MNNNPESKPTELKFVIVTEIHDAKTAKGNAYYYFLDQDKMRWNVFPEKFSERLILKRGYEIEFVKNGEYNNVISMKPTINKLKEEVAKDLADINSIKKDLFMSLSYAKDLAVGQVIQPTQIFEKAREIYDWINSTSESIISKKV